MRPLRTYTVEPALPVELENLLPMARNLWWSWNHDAQAIFRRLDPDLWDITHHNPIAILGRVDQRRLDEMARNEGFLAQLNRVYAQFESYLNSPDWWDRVNGKSERPQIAYFCAEFGLSESLPIYSGGLGVLAGDHMKSASELNIPLIGVGLMYQQGYFRQRLNADGWQLELYPRNDFHNLPVDQVCDSDGNAIKISVELPGRTVWAQVWQIKVGRINMFMMDSNVQENSPEDRRITSQLYGGNHEMRIQQEILLGIGGIRMLRALGITPKAYHMNEGHSAFLTLERIRNHMHENAMSFDEAREVVAASSVFTTHTPVPAGNDTFEPWLVEKYFSDYCGQIGLSVEDLMKLGQAEPYSADDHLNMTILALHTSRFHNGVSQLHAEVSREMWKKVWPALPEHEVPILDIVNGIHTRTWLSEEMSTLLDRYLGPAWRENPSDATVWESAMNIPDEELWRTHERRRERLVAFARKHTRLMLTKRGAAASELEAAAEVLDPEALTIGFARRFATYKRATLILRDLDRLKKLLNDADRPVQIIFAGKAHPKDTPGKELIRDLIHTSRSDEFRHKMLFLEDYDMNVARYLVQGVDVWLNTPRRPMEASGTSGMKAAANGALNLSIPDGWWEEGYTPKVGWCIGEGEMYEDEEYQDAVESRSLYDLLEKSVIPLFYDRTSDGLPRKWVSMMKHAIAQLAPVFSTNRMVRDYSEMFYVPAIRNWDVLSGDNYNGSRDLNSWKSHLLKHFGEVRIESVVDNINTDSPKVGQCVEIEAIVHVGALSTDDLDVELFHGEVGSEGQIEKGKSVVMGHAEDMGDARHKYTIQVPCKRSGLAGYTVRVVPGKGSRDDSRLGKLVRWA